MTRRGPHPTHATASARTAPSPPSRRTFLAATVAAFAAWTTAAARTAEPGTAPLRLRFGHFPNITQPQALVAHQLSRQGRGWFEAALGPGAAIDWYVFNAGPSAMEAFFTDSLDVAYVGPGPAINAYLRSHGEEVRIIAGAAEGGAALVVASASSITGPTDFRGKRLATPQLGNTQDIAARAWLSGAGLKVTQTGGDVLVLPTANPDQLDLLASGAVDGVWTVEPWVSRLLRDAHGRVLVEQHDPVTVLTARAAFVAGQPERLATIRSAHQELTRWIVAHPDEAKALIVTELSELTRRKFDRALLDAAWPRILPTETVAPAALDRVREQLRASGFLRNDATLDRLLAPQSP